MVEVLGLIWLTALTVFTFFLARRLTTLEKTLQEGTAIDAPILKDAPQPQPPAKEEDDTTDIDPIIY